MATSVFLSHSASDEELARKVAAHSRPLEVSTYMYEDDAQPGEHVAQKLQDRIRRADAVVVLLTKNSQHRPTVHTEVGIARAMGKPIIPVIEVGVDPLQFVFLQGIEWIVLDLDKIDEALLGIQNSLKRLKDLAEENPLVSAAILFVVAAIILYLATRKA